MKLLLRTVSIAGRALKLKRILINSIQSVSLCLTYTCFKEGGKYIFQPMFNNLITVKKIRARFKLV